MRSGKLPGSQVVLGPVMLVDGPVTDDFELPKKVLIVLNHFHS